MCPQLHEALRDAETHVPPAGCYSECVADTKKSLITVTAMCAAIATLAMGVFANLPFALAPGMGLNAYFTYTVVGFMGSNSKNIDWKTAITAVFIEGLFFFVLSVTGARSFIARAIPKSIKLATTGGASSLRPPSLSRTLTGGQYGVGLGPG